MAYWKIATLYDGSFFHGHPFTDIDPRISAPDYIFEFTKSAPSIFFQTPIHAWLTKHCIDTTIITGCTTSGCVRASIVDSFSYGFRTIVPEDCCGDQNEEAHWSNLRDVGRRYADVMTSTDVIEQLDIKHPLDS
jgi:maleamate amidohydrolase